MIFFIYTLVLVFHQIVISYIYIKKHTIDIK